MRSMAVTTRVSPACSRPCRSLRAWAGAPGARAYFLLGTYSRWGCDGQDRAMFSTSASVRADILLRATLPLVVAENDISVWAELPQVYSKDFCLAVNEFGSQGFFDPVVRSLHGQAV